MNNGIIHTFTQALKDQKDIFGDEIMQENFPVKVNISVRSAIPPETNAPLENAQMISQDLSGIKSLEALNRHICECMKCPLGKKRNKFVFGTGNPDAEIMLIGEGPGADEDEQGVPFVGPAGQLLNKILEAINFKRADVYIANVVKCRPPGNRNPLPNEMEMCMPYLQKQIELVRPRIILCLGLVAAAALLKTKQSLSNMRGNVYELYGAKVMVTYHPAALLRNPQWKRGCWEDVQQLRKIYDGMTR